MVTIPVKTRLKPDGTLDLQVPTGLPESEVDVVVVIQPISETPGVWPGDFFSETYGAFHASPLERPPQLQFRQRESLH